MGIIAAIIICHYALGRAREPQKRTRTRTRIVRARGALIHVVSRCLGVLFREARMHG